MQRSDEYTKAHAIYKAWCYAQHFGGVDHMVGVLWVIKNRVDSGWGSPLQVIETMPAHEAASPPTISHPPAWDRRFLALLQAVDGVFDHTAKDHTNGGLWVADTTNITNDDFLHNVARSLLVNDALILVLGHIGNLRRDGSADANTI